MGIKRKLIDGKLKCALCNEYKELTLFPKNKSAHLGVYSYCKLCAKSRTNKQYHAKKQDAVFQEAKLRSSVKDRFNISLEEYLAFKAQRQVCEICSNPFKSSFDCQLDHCHTTGKLRGVLCSKCNKGLGMFHDNRVYLAQAINYLDRTTQ